MFACIVPTAFSFPMIFFLLTYIRMNQTRSPSCLPSSCHFNNARGDRDKSGGGAARRIDRCDSDSSLPGGGGEQLDIHKWPD